MEEHAMLTLTARQHLENALVNALRIAPYQATEILDRHDNFHELDYLASPLHGTKALICEAHGTKTATAHLFRNLGKGYEPIGMLKLRDKDLSSWLWYNKGDALPTAREITENLRRGTEYRSEEHTSELQHHMRISYAVLCLKNTNHTLK